MIKLDESDVEEIRKMYQRGLPTDRLAERYPVKKRSIIRVLNGKSWADAPGPTVTRVRGEQIEGTRRKRAIKRELFEGENYEEISRRYDISVEKLARVARGEIWQKVEVNNA